jgi:mono/diheme cytochrome c family protein
MKTLLKVIGWIVGLLVLAAGALYVYFLVILPPDLPVPDLTIERTPARVERGRYLASAVFGCMYCHSERDWDLFGGPPKPGMLGKGGERFDESSGLPGAVIAPNLTPYHLGDWSDGEIYRAIVSGLHKDGYAFFPVMPFDAYLHLETEDVYAIIAYLRTLEPIESGYTGRRLGLLMKFIANSRVKPADPWAVDRSNPVARGEYIVVIAGCRFCHTPANERMQPLEGMRFAGGLGMPTRSGKVYSANISPDKETGIGKWTVEDFIRRFKAYEGRQVPVSEVGYQTQHAWTEYARMSVADLADIYAYLMAQPPVLNRVTPTGDAAGAALRP